jgi:hypothetical protein
MRDRRTHFKNWASTPGASPRLGRSLALPVSIRTRMKPILAIVCSISLLVTLASSSAAQTTDMLQGLDPTDVGSTAAPVTQYSEGYFFSQDLGTMLRLGYRTESYGQNDHGNLEIGTMQVANFDNSIAFFDGQVTLNDIQGVGFNIGVGYRWMHMAPYVLEGERVSGWSLWADGTSTRADNFFPQIGISFESLGNLWDFRANGYIPVGDEDQIGDFEPTGEIAFEENFISQITQATVDSSFYVAEGEFARRLGADRDAWAFAGPYFLGNNDDETVGYKVGLRGYATPDLLLQFAVSDDEIFKTKATFSLVWFVGRTRTDFMPACGLPDRLREPVLRNDYVALTQSFVRDGIPLTDLNDEVIRIVHVDSDAPAGGNGTFEAPLNNLDDILGNSQEGDIVFAHAESVFTGQNAVLQDNQRFLGEGNDEVFTVATTEEGTINIPESSPGARALTRPQINASPGDAITLADANEVANFDIDGQGVTARAIASPVGGSGNPNLHDLAISNTTDDGIALTTLVFTDTEDLDEDGNTTEQIIRGNVTINDITFDSIGGDDIDIDSDAGALLPTTPNVTFQETITINNVTSTNGGGSGVRLQNTHDGRTATISNYVNGNDTPGSGGGTLADGVLHFNDITGDLVINTATIKGNTGFAFDFNDIDALTSTTISNLTYDGQDAMSGMAGGIRAVDYDGTMTVNTSTFTNGTLQGVLLGADSDGTFTFATTTSFNSVDGTTFEIDGGVGDTFTGIVNMNSAITNDSILGYSVDVKNIGSVGTAVTFTGNITDNGGLGVKVEGNSNGTVRFTGELDITTTGANNAVTLLSNTGATINFENKLDLTTAAGTGFDATGGGTLTATDTENVVTSATGTAVEITNMTIASGGSNSVTFAEINRTAGAAAAAIRLENNTGGPIVLGTVGETTNGILQGGAATTVVITNSANVTLSGLEIRNGGGQTGVAITKNTSGTQTTNLNDLMIEEGATGVGVTGGGPAAGALNLTINDTAISAATGFGMDFFNVDVGTIQVNNVDIDGMNVMAGAVGVRIQDSDASFVFDADTSTVNINGTDFEVDGGAGGSISFGGDIMNTLGQSVHVHDRTGGSVTFSAASTIDDDGLGILVENNSGGSVAFLGTNDLDPLVGATEAVFLNNNSGATITFAGLNILTANTSTTRGFVAQGGGTLSVTGTNNRITTDAGAGLALDGMTIGAVDFREIDVNTNGGAAPANAIVLQNLTGGQVAIGPSSTTPADGGTLNTSADAIILRNTQNVDLRQIRIDSAGNNAVLIEHTAAATTLMDITIDGLEVNSVLAGGTAISVTGSDTNALNLRLTDSLLADNVAIDIMGSGAFGLLVDNTDITAADAGDDAFSLEFSGASTGGDVTIRNGNNFTAVSGNALFIDSFGAAGKTVDLLVTGSLFNNDSAGSPTASITSRQTSLMNATIQNNTFTNANPAGVNFDITSSGAAAFMRLNLGGSGTEVNLAASGTGEFRLHELLGSDFDVFERDDTFNDLRNTGTVVTDPNDAAFDDLPVAPPLPTVP